MHYLYIVISILYHHIIITETDRPTIFLLFSRPVAVNKINKSSSL